MHFKSWKKFEPKKLIVYTGKSMLNAKIIYRELVNGFVKFEFRPGFFREHMTKMSRYLKINSLAILRI